MNRSIARVIGVPGFELEFGTTVERIRSLDPGSEGDVPDLLHLSVQARGRRVGDYSSKLRLRLDRDQTATESTGVILRHLLTAIRANVDGVLADLDVEFLHDLRVASRRTRSALTQLKGVLPTPDVTRFVSEFKWLGTVTGPCRDLDVQLMEMATYRELLPEYVDALEPLERVVEDARLQAHHEVRECLQSSRFSDLLDGWRAFLDTGCGAGAATRRGDTPIGKLASKRIHKAYRRMVKNGNGLGDEPPAEALHRLRIDAKKLRYLLEFFRSLYPKKKIEPLVRELKSFQDILGGFNDMEVQQERLIEFARVLSDARVDHAETLIAMGRLASALKQRQEDYRHAFAGRFEIFADDESQERYTSLFASGK